MGPPRRTPLSKQRVATREPDPEGPTGPGGSAVTVGVFPNSVGRRLVSRGGRRGTDYGHPFSSDSCFGFLFRILCPDCCFGVSVQILVSDYASEISFPMFYSDSCNRCLGSSAARLSPESLNLNFIFSGEGMRYERVNMGGTIMA